MSNPDSELIPDTEGFARCTVAAADLASALSDAPGDAFPAVFATTRMIALMEIAASRALQPLLAPGQLSVGVTVDVRHTAATPLGGRVEARARYLGREGKLWTFEVVATDDAGEIGRGRHQRAIVDTARLVSAAQRRLGEER